MLSTYRLRGGPARVNCPAVPRGSSRTSGSTSNPSASSWRTSPAAISDDFPAPDGRVEQDDPLGDHEVEQVGGLPITPVEGVASAEGLRPDVRVASRLRGADLGAHERDSATQWLCSSLMKLSVLPQ